MLCNAMQSNPYRSSSKLDFFVGLERRILSSLNHRDAVTSNNPLFPILAQLNLAGNDFSLSELANCHMRMEVLISLELRNGVGDDVVNILQLIAIRLGIQEDSPMREAVQLSEDDVEGAEIIESLLQDVIGLLEDRSINEGKAKIDVGLPPGKSRIVLLTQGLDLLVVVLDCKGQGSVGNELDVLDCLHCIA